MFRSIWDDIKQQYQFGNMVIRLIILNLAVFLVVKLMYVLLTVFGGVDSSGSMYQAFVHFFSISANDWVHNLTHPWVIVTHMFLHEGVLHVLFNMLFLYWFGRIVGDFLGDQRVLPLYLLGGLTGALFYVMGIGLLGGLSESSTATRHFAMGASAAVMAHITAAAATSPDYQIRLLFFGNVRLKHIAFVLILIDLYGLGSNANTGGHIGHLGGALMGLLFVRQLRQGKDWSVPVNNLLGRLTSFWERLRKSGPPIEKQRPRPRVVYRGDQEKIRHSKQSRRPQQIDHQERLDSILEKIKASGYDNLSAEEKEFLFNASKK